MSPVDPKDDQPLSGGPVKDHRVYIPSEWAPAGGGSGHPKLSGGETIDHRSGAPAPRAYNRPDQRYSEAESSLISKRLSRAHAEYLDTVVLLGAGLRFEVRSVSGNNYDQNETLSACDCPDFLRLRQSGYLVAACKHIEIVHLALVDGSLPEGIPWAVSKLAEYAAVEERTVQQWCARGECVATKRFGVWIIQPSEAIAQAARFALRRIF